MDGKSENPNLQKVNEEVQKLAGLFKPLMEYLKCNCDPYTEICISCEGIKVKQTIIGIPDEKAATKK